MPNWYILASQKIRNAIGSKYGCCKMNLIKITPRDNESQTYKMQAVLCEKYKWNDYGEQEKESSAI